MPSMESFVYVLAGSKELDLKNAHFILNPYLLFSQLTGYIFWIVNYKIDFKLTIPLKMHDAKSPKVHKRSYL